MNFEWIDYYTEFATKLLTFKDNREELIHKIYSIYDNIGISVPKLEKDDEITDIDPFTVFGLFNKGITKVKSKFVCKFIFQLCGFIYATFIFKRFD